MVDPGEALCGLLLADADYFSVGTVDTKQLLDYARRRGLDVELVKNSYRIISEPHECRRHHQ